MTISLHGWRACLPRRVATFAGAILLMAPAPLLAGSPNVERLTRATEALLEIMQAPDKGIPKELLDSAYGIVIVPGMKKGAFIIGGKYGKGYILCRRKSGVGWSAPGNVIVEGGSFGFQIGGEESDVILLVMNQGGMNHLLSSKFTLGAGGTIAAGPVGRTAKAETDAMLDAEILSWSRAHGIFAGVSLQGASVRQDMEDNQSLYGKALTNKEIIEGHTPVPPAAKKLVAQLDKYSPHREGSKSR